MALHQADTVVGLMRDAYPGLTVERVVIQSDGDINQGDLRPFGGKGAFVSRLDQALLSDEIDLTVNCMKDIPQAAERAPGVQIVGALPREEYVDAVITRSGKSLSELPDGSTVGTSSPRRHALLSRVYPNLRPVYFRGSSDTRVRKLDAGEVDAVVLCVAGLRRIGLGHRVTELTDPAVFLPAIGAGIVTMDCLGSRSVVVELITRVSDPSTMTMLRAERAFIDAIQGNCHTAVAGHSSLDGDQVLFSAAIFSANGREMIVAQKSGPSKSAASVGQDVAAELLALGASRILGR